MPRRGLPSPHEPDWIAVRFDASSVPQGPRWMEGAADRLLCRSACRFTTRGMFDSLAPPSGGRRCSATVRRGCFSLPLPSLSPPRSPRRRSDSTRSDRAPSREGLRRRRRPAVMRRRSSGTRQPPPGSPDGMRRSASPRWRSSGNFDQDTTFRRFDADVPTSYVPHVFVNYHADKSKFAYGLGVYVPYGLTSQWHDDFPGRFSALKATLSRRSTSSRTSPGSSTRSGRSAADRSSDIRASN